MEPGSAPGPALESEAARLPGYRLAFDMRDGDEVFANIVPQPGAEVWGVAYRCTEEGLRHMDTWECVAEGQYERRSVDVHVRAAGGDRVEVVVAYVARAPFLGPEAAPAAWYLSRILRGARHHGLSEAWIEAIERAARPSR